jgi:hypothetical protein
MHRRALSILTAALVATGLTCASPVAAVAARPIAADQSSSTLGIDVSWPQCGTKLPQGQAFAVVGVTGGLANDTNPCLSSQLAWAEKSSGVTGQPKVELYVNTANPGMQASWWPSTNSMKNGLPVANPYGSCAGAEGAACAYVYGYSMAYDDFNNRGVLSPVTYRWWLDVELINTWQADKAANAASLEGMTAYFRGKGAQVGLYSTSYQWGIIVGKVSAASNLNGLRSWIPGSSSERTARTACLLPPLTTGGTVAMTQFVVKNLDYNVSCS